MRAVRRQADDEQRHQRDAHRQVHEKAPAPADVLRQPSADHRAEQRPEQHDQPEHRHADRHLRERQPRADNGLRSRNQRTAGEALTDAAGDHHRQRVRPAAHHRKCDEQCGIGEQEIAQAEHAREPRGEGDHHDLGHQVAGRDPRALRAGRADFALDLRQRRVRDRDVERRHQCAERARGDGDPVGDARALGFSARRGRPCGGWLSHDDSRLRYADRDHARSAYRRRRSPTAPAAARCAFPCRYRCGSARAPAARSW